MQGVGRMASADSWAETPTGDARPCKRHLEWNAGKTADPQAQLLGIDR